MNVIVSNLNKQKFNNLNVDLIKSMNGEFSSEELVQTFSNFFFNRMFLDITYSKNYRDINHIQKLSIGLDVSKIILLLNDDPVVNDAYISKLVSLGIYNFARNEDELLYLYNNPNQYKDVAKYQNVNSSFIGESNSFVQDSDESSKRRKPRVIGFKNFTNHAGSTTLIYMIKKQLEKNYSVISLEINKTDFIFFNDKGMVSIKDDEINRYLEEYTDVNIILMDLNNVVDDYANSFCTEFIYLIEPSLLAINKVSKADPKSLVKLRNYKVVLNKCLLSDKDISVFSREARIKIFYALPPMNDRDDNSKILLPFLERLGLYKKVTNESADTSKNKFFKF